MNTFDIDTITNTLAYEAAVHHRTRLATDRIHMDMIQKKEALERRTLVGEAHELPVFATTQATRSSRIPTIYEGAAVEKLHCTNSHLINKYGIGLHTLFSKSYTHEILVELADFWNAEIANANMKVTALAEGNVITTEDLPYFLLSPTDFPKGCRRRFFMHFSFLKHFSHAVNNAIWCEVAALHKGGYFIGNGTKPANTDSTDSNDTDEA
jgi:hypothetical protein